MVMSTRDALDRASELLVELDGQITDGGDASVGEVAALATGWSAYAHASAAAEQAEAQQAHADRISALADEQAALFRAERARIEAAADEPPAGDE